MNEKTLFTWKYDITIYLYSYEGKLPLPFVATQTEENGALDCFKAT